MDRIAAALGASIARMRNARAAMPASGARLHRIRACANGAPVEHVDALMPDAPAVTATVES